MQFPWKGRKKKKIWEVDFLSSENVKSGAATHQSEIRVIFGETQAQFHLHLRRHSPQHAVKNVIVPLVKSLKQPQKHSVGTQSQSPTHGTRPNQSHLPAHSGFLQQVLLNPGALDGAALVEVDIDIFPEAAGVVIPNSFGISKS